ncbi:MAG: tetratricopeptide repeat protein [Acidobacteria bacterium]|nr:tetratricopeptide repeat protein [Acidobacteriota bacterium]
MGKTWNRVEEVFNAAMELPVGRRTEFVRSQCSGAAYAEVMELLKAEGGMGEFLAAPLTDFRGQIFGAYRAVREAGRGGMSVVYEGERIDGDFDKRVAIKVVLVQAAGETRILAGLEHPNIARLLDSGVTEFGFRYLVMEYVDGVPIAEYSKPHGTDRKLRLLLQVCAGVQYAHRSLVVHRDLKPDNILVTADGTVKLLDFGIAKLLESGAAAQTTGVRAYTADYASPEQILGKPVTTAADVYSLGVLMCELLGGSVPRRLTGLEIGEVVERVGQEEVRDVPMTGDLAIIARKALRRSPEERYDSVSAFARDIENYLNRLPIEARPPSFAYQFGKFVARNRWAVGAAAVAVIALSVTGGIAFWQARLAAARFDQVHSLARSVMFEMHDAVESLPGSLPARQMIVTRSLSYLDALAKDENAPEQVQLDVVRGYLRMADIQGKDLGGASIGKTEDALASARQAVAIARRLQRRSSDPAVRRALVEGLRAVSSASTLRGDSDGAIAAATESVALARAGTDRGQLAFALKQLGDALARKRKDKEAVELLRESLALRKELAEAAPNDPRAQQRLAEAHHWLATTLLNGRDFAGAEPHAREAYRLDKIRFEGPDRRAARANLGVDIGLLAALAGRNGRHEESRVLYVEQLAIRREILAEDPKSAVARMRVAASLDRLGRASLDSGHKAEAVKHGEEAAVEFRAMRAADPGNQSIRLEAFWAFSDLAQTYDGLGNRARACGLGREVLAVVEGKATESFRAQTAPAVKRAKAIVAKCPGG